MADFEELAERLTSAPSAEERLAAAEALSRLDDPRVAPTLARALADPDERVRRGVEEILSQFSRRDSVDNLRALLEEAERVAAALAGEVQRLKGATDPDVSAAPRPIIRPIPPPEDYAGECAVVRLTDTPMDIRRVSRLVARRLGRVVFEVAREINTTKGFVARGVSAETARALVAELAELDVPVAAVPMAQVPEAIQPERVRNPQFGSRGVKGNLLPSGEVEVGWEEVALVVAARIELDLHPGGLSEDWSLFTQPLKPRKADRRPQFEYVVEVFTTGSRRLRLLTHELDFREFQRRPTNFARVARLGRQLVRRVARERLGAGLWLLADGDEENWDRLTFASPVGYEDYVVWQRLLLQLEVPLPR